MTATNTLTIRLAVPPSFVVRDAVFLQSTPTTDTSAPGALINDILSLCTGGVTLSVETPPLFGSVALNQDGSFVYTPNNPSNLVADQFLVRVSCNPDIDYNYAWVYLPGG